MRGNGASPGKVGGVSWASHRGGATGAALGCTWDLPWWRDVVEGRGGRGILESLQQYPEYQGLGHTKVALQ